jgi:hypothetical protein
MGTGSARDGTGKRVVLAQTIARLLRDGVLLSSVQEHSGRQAHACGPLQCQGGTQRKVKMARIFRDKIAMPGDHREASVEA